MVAPNTRVEVPIGSEHEYVCCALTTHVPLRELKELVPPALLKFIEFDHKVDQRLHTRAVVLGPPIHEVYDVDRFFEGLNLHNQYRDQSLNPVGKWYTPQAPSRQAVSTFKSFKL